MDTINISKILIKNKKLTFAEGSIELPTVQIINEIAKGIATFGVEKADADYVLEVWKKYATGDVEYLPLLPLNFVMEYNRVMQKEVYEAWENVPDLMGLKEPSKNEQNSEDIA